MRRMLLFTGFFFTTPLIIIFSALFLLFLSYQQRSSMLGFSFFGSTQKAIAYAALPATSNVVSDTIGEKDSRVERVQSFLTWHHSPLAQYADIIVLNADKHNIDFRLVPAIAMQESGGCNKVITNTNNCWGYGIYKGHVTTFPSIADGIDTVSLYLEHKKNQGFDTIEELGKIYNPQNVNDWTGHVQAFYSEI